MVIFRTASILIFLSVIESSENSNIQGFRKITFIGMQMYFINAPSDKTDESFNKHTIVKR